LNNLLEEYRTNELYSKIIVDLVGVDLLDVETGSRSGKCFKLLTC